jgi:hypothetical protein
MSSEATSKIARRVTNNSTEIATDTHLLHVFSRAVSSPSSGLFSLRLWRTL